MEKALKAIIDLQANTIQTLVDGGDYRIYFTSEYFLKTNPTKLAVIGGAVIYEDPEEGDEVPPIVVFNGIAYTQDYYDTEDIVAALSAL